MLDPRDKILEDLVTVWESMPPGRNSVRETQAWVYRLHPVVVRARNYLDEQRTKSLGR